MTIKRGKKSESEGTRAKEKESETGTICVSQQKRAGITPVAHRG